MSSKRITLAVAAVAGLLTLTQIAFAATQSFSASAVIKQPIAISKDTGKDLVFGVLRPNVSEPATVTVSTAGERTISGASLVSGTDDTYQAAQFSVSGEPFANIQSSCDPSLTLYSGLNTISVTELNASLSSSSLSESGSATMTVGGVLTLPAKCPPGVYTGEFTVGVAYW